MSRSNPSENLTNPSTRYFEWNGSKGHVKYYDSGSKTTIEVPLPFRFLPLDALSTVTGYDEKGKSRIYANLVRPRLLGKTPLTVRSKGSGILAQGLYRDIKSQILAAGGKFAVSLYVAYAAAEDEWATGSLMLKGAAAGAWMDFEKQHKSPKVFASAIVIGDKAEGKNGGVRYFTPIFSLETSSSAEDAAAIALDTEVQAYLATIVAQAPEPPAEEPEPVTAGAATDVDEDSIPF